MVITCKNNLESKHMFPHAGSRKPIGSALWNINLKLNRHCPISRNCYLDRI